MLTDLATLKAFLEIPDGSEDVKLLVMLAGADAAVKRYLGQPRIEPRATYTEYYSGNNTDVLRLTTRPAYTITSVYADATGYAGTGTDPFNATTLLTQGVDYFLDPDQPDGSSWAGRLRRINGVWSPRWRRSRGLLTSWLDDGQKNVKVTYAAGFLTPPKDLGMAVSMVVARVRQMMPRGGLLSAESYEGYSYSLLSQIKNLADDYLGPAVGILAPYRALNTY